jgi:hypothetical protein
VHDVTAVLVGDVFRPEVKKLFEPMSTMVPIPESTPLDKPKAAKHPASAPSAEAAAASAR